MNGPHGSETKSGVKRPLRRRSCCGTCARILVQMVLTVTFMVLLLALLLRAGMLGTAGEEVRSSEAVVAEGSGGDRGAQPQSSSSYSLLAGWEHWLHGGDFSDGDVRDGGGMAPSWWHDVTGRARAAWDAATSSPHPTTTPSPPSSLSSSGRGDSGGTRSLGIAADGGPDGSIGKATKKLAGAALGRDLLERAGDPSGAEAVCSGASKRDPEGDSEAWICLGEARLVLSGQAFSGHADAADAIALRRLSLARDNFETATSIDPTDPDARAGLGLSLLLLGTRQPEQIRQNADMHQTSDQHVLFDAILHLSAAVSLTEPSRYDVEDSAKGNVDGNGRDTGRRRQVQHLAALHNLAMAHLALGDAKAAVPVLKSAISQVDEAPHISGDAGVMAVSALNLGGAFLELGLVNNATEVLNSVAVQICDVDKEAWGALGTREEERRAKLCSLILSNLGLVTEQLLGKDVLSHQAALDTVGQESTPYWDAWSQYNSSIQLDDLSEVCFTQWNRNAFLSDKSYSKFHFGGNDVEIHQSRNDSSSLVAPRESEATALLLEGESPMSSLLTDELGGEKALTRNETSDTNETMEIQNQGVMNKHKAETSPESNFASPRGVLTTRSDNATPLPSELQDTLDDLERYVSENPNRSRHWLNLAKALHHAGDEAGAAKAAIKAMDTASDKDEIEAAEATFEKALSKLPRVGDDDLDADGALKPGAAGTYDQVPPSREDKGADLMHLQLQYERLENSYLRLEMQHLVLGRGQNQPFGHDAIPAIVERSAIDAEHRFDPKHSRTSLEGGTRSPSYQGKDQHGPIEMDGSSTGPDNGSGPAFEKMRSSTTKAETEPSVDHGDDTSQGDVTAAVADNTKHVENKEALGKEQGSVPLERGAADNTKHVENKEALGKEQNSVSLERGGRQAEEAADSAKSEPSELSGRESDAWQGERTAVEANKTDMESGIDKLRSQQEEESFSETSASDQQTSGDEVEEQEEQVEKTVTTPKLFDPAEVKPKELPAIAKSYMKMADAYLDKNDYKLATKQFQKVLKKAPDHLPAILGYATALERCSRPKQLGEVALAYGNATKAAVSQGEGGAPLGKAGEGGMAENILRRAVQVASSASENRLGIFQALSEVAHTAVLAADIYCCIGKELLHQNDTDARPKAVEAFNVANAYIAEVGEEGVPFHGKAMVQLGKIAIDMDGDAEKALSYFTAAQSVQGLDEETHISALVLSGNARKYLGDMDKAIIDYREAISFLPETETSAVAHHELAVALSASGGDQTEVEKHFEKALDLGMALTTEAIQVLGEHNISVMRSSYQAQWSQLNQAGAYEGGGIMSGGGVVSSQSVFAPQKEVSSEFSEASQTLSMIEQGAVAYTKGEVPSGGEGDSSLSAVTGRKS